VRKLEADLASKEEQLLAKKEAEKALNRSLKDALGLLKPLQMHLEDAENEKKEIAKELQDLKRQLAGDGSRSTVGARSVDADAVRDLEITVRQLEKENSQLHDALENMSQSLNASHLSGGAGVKNDARLREELVELKSRYEVTQGRLEDAFVENHTLVEALQKREREEKELSNEVKTLREKLKITQVELENAKFIATSALVKVEELTMKHVELGSGLDHDSLYKEKAKQLDQEMKGAGQRYRN
jgi:predicted nuclease with TOPRIM domain